jgi:hypothetical protein
MVGTETDVRACLKIHPGVDRLQYPLVASACIADTLCSMDCFGLRAPPAADFADAQNATSSSKTV